MADRIEDGNLGRRRVMFDAVTGQRSEVRDDPDLTIDGASSNPWERLETRPASKPAKKSSKDRSAQRISDDRVIEYRELIDLWTSGSDFARDANSVEAAKNRRIKLASELAREGLIGDPVLRPVASYLAADVGYNSRPRPEEERYSEFVAHRAKMRDMISPENMLDPEGYVRSARVTQKMITKGTHIEDQYDLLEIRREAALESFGDPRFTVEAGTIMGGDFADEVLMDFDRDDLASAQGSERSEILSEIFMKSVNERSSADCAHGRTLAFMKMRETGACIRDNHKALIHFGQRTMDSRTDRDLGLAALENATFRPEMVEEFCADVPRKERKRVYRNIKTMPGVFQEARADFEKRLAAGDPKCARSFAIMERAARDILKSEKDISTIVKDAPDDASALFLFSQEGRDNYCEPIRNNIESELLDEMKDRGSYTHEGKRDVRARGSDKSGNEFILDMSEKGADIHIEAVDGGRIRVAMSAEDAREGRFIEGKLADMSVPKRGVMTKDGSKDAGEASREYLEMLMNKDIRGLSVVMSGEQNRDRKFHLRMANGEDISQRMIRDGYAAPVDNPRIRHEHLAKSSEAQRRGLWQNGFVDMSEDWRTETHRPNLSDKDRHSDLARKRGGTVANAMAGNSNDVLRKLSGSETKIFALPLEKWSGLGAVDREVARVVGSNPGRVRSIYDRNQELIDGLRSRKGKLTEVEKLAHDRLSMGSRALARSLVRAGHLSREEAQKNAGDMMSSKAFSLPENFLRKPTEAAVKTTAAGYRLGRRGASILNDVITSSQDFGVR